MLPIDQSPTKEKAVKDLRVAEWVCDSASSIKAFDKVKTIMQKSPAPKRKMSFNAENIPTLASAAKRQKMEKTATKPLRKTSKPMSPRKFYVPNGDEQYKGIPIPSTPESKMSCTSSSLCFSPGKLEGILIRRKSTASPALISNETESPQSTPTKKKPAPQKFHLLSCGLDSPESESTGTLKSSEKKFSKLGHRVNSKTPLQLYHESIKHSTRKMNTCGRRSTSKTPTNPKKTDTLKVEDCEEAPPSDTVLDQTVTTETTTETTTNTQTSLNQSTVTSVSTVKSESRIKASDDIDKSNNTLVESPNLVQKKLLPLFKRSSTSNTQAREKDQMVIDAGQKGFDEAHQCVVCRMIYTRGDPNDETLHKQFHSQLTQALKFTGWKKENIAAKGADHRIMYIDSNDAPHCKKKVQALKVILDQELGFVQEDEILKPNRRVYIYIGETEKQIKGVCIAESISRANRLDGDKASVQAVRASVGVNRLWVYAKYRRSGVATKLLDAVRSTFGMGMCIPRSDMAFSDPTFHGKMFAARYTSTKQFLVYKP